MRLAEPTEQTPGHIRLFAGKQPPFCPYKRNNIAANRTWNGFFANTIPQVEILLVTLQKPIY